MDRPWVPAFYTRTNDLDMILRKGSFIVFIPLVIILAIEFCCLIWGTFDVFEYIRKQRLSIFILLPNIVTITHISGTMCQAYWIFIEVSLIISIALLAYQSRDLLKSKDAYDMLERAEKTPLYNVTVMFSASIALELVVMLIGELTGNGITVPSSMTEMTRTEELFEYAEAAVWEEVVSRLLPIGVPMVVVALACKKKDFYKYLFGGFGFSKLSIVLLIASSAAFGFAHMGGWGWTKVLPASIAGVFMGYLYVKYGVHASIAMHFLTDYLSVAMDSVGLGLVSMLYLLAVFAGYICLVLCFKRLWEHRQYLKDTPMWLPDDQEMYLFKKSSD